MSSATFYDPSISNMPANHNVPKIEQTRYQTSSHLSFADVSSVRKASNESVALVGFHCELEHCNLVR
jgi:hypothetical protein